MTRAKIGVVLPLPRGRDALMVVWRWIVYERHYGNSTWVFRQALRQQHRCAARRVTAQVEFLEAFLAFVLLRLEPGGLWGGLCVRPGTEHPLTISTSLTSRFHCSVVAIQDLCSPLPRVHGRGSKTPWIVVETMVARYEVLGIYT